MKQRKYTTWELRFKIAAMASTFGLCMSTACDLSAPQPVTADQPVSPEVLRGEQVEQMLMESAGVQEALTFFSNRGCELDLSVDEEEFQSDPGIGFAGYTHAFQPCDATDRFANLTAVHGEDGNVIAVAGLTFVLEEDGDSRNFEGFLADAEGTRQFEDLATYDDAATDTLLAAYPWDLSSTEALENSFDSSWEGMPPQPKGSTPAAANATAYSGDCDACADCMAAVVTAEAVTLGACTLYGIGATSLLGALAAAVCLAGWEVCGIAILVALATGAVTLSCAAGNPPEPGRRHRKICAAEGKCSEPECRARQTQTIEIGDCTQEQICETEGCEAFTWVNDPEAPTCDL